MFAKANAMAKECDEMENGLMNFDEAEKMDELESKFFKAESNIEYVLTFSNWKLEIQTVPDYNDKNKQTKKPVLVVTVDSINGTKTKVTGEPIAKEWGILSRKLRETFRPFCESGNITKKTYKFKAKGDGKDRTYTLLEVGDKHSP